MSVTLMFEIVQCCTISVDLI